MPINVTSVTSFQFFVSYLERKLVMVIFFVFVFGDGIENQKKKKSGTLHLMSVNRGPLHLKLCFHLDCDISCGNLNPFSQALLAIIFCFCFSFQFGKCTQNIIKLADLALDSSCTPVKEKTTCAYFLLT